MSPSNIPLCVGIWIPHLMGLYKVPWAYISPLPNGIAYQSVRLVLHRSPGYCRFRHQCICLLAHVLTSSNFIRMRQKCDDVNSPTCDNMRVAGGSARSISGDVAKCTSGFVDDVVFAHINHAYATQNRCIYILKVTLQEQHRSRTQLTATIA